MKNLLFFSIFMLLATFCSTLVADEGEPVKLAIVGNTVQHYAIMDMLTEKFSRQLGLTLLERNDIDYIIKEHKFVVTALAKNGLRIGQLLGADGVIIVSTVKVNDKNYIYLRLVSVKAGIIIATAIYQLDQQSEAFNWGTAAVRYFSPLLAKLIFNRDELINISMLNFRTSDPSIKMTALEQVIPKLLTIYLSRIPQIVVNERWNSWQVAFEKMLKHDFTVIKTGNILIDGEIRRSSKTNVITSSKNGFIEIAIRVNRQTQKAQKTIKVSGQVRQLPALIEKLAKKIQLYLNNSSTTAPWDIKAEAQRFYKDAQWAYDFGKMQQAKAAIEVAVVLGLDSFDAALLQARILVEEPFTIQDNDYRALHYSVPFQYEDKIIENTAEYLLDTCRALDILSELHRRMTRSGYYDKWKIKENFRRLDQLERNFLVYCPRLIMNAYQQKLHENYRFADTLLLLQLKTRKLFHNIISRPNWDNRTGDDHKIQAYMVFFATGICWYNNLDQWLKQFDKLLQDNCTGSNLSLIRRGLAEGRNRFNRCGKQWPFKLKCFTREYYGTPLPKLFNIWGKYIAKLEKNRAPVKRLNGVILRDYSATDRQQCGLKIFAYIIKTVNHSAIGSPEYKQMLMAIKMLKTSYFSIFHQYRKLNPQIINSICKLITSSKTPQWTVIAALTDVFQNDMKLVDRQAIKRAVDDYKKKFGVKNINTVCKSKYFCQSYNKLITPKAKPPQYLPANPLTIPVWLDLTDSKLKSYGMHRSYEKICKFKAYDNKLLYIVTQAWLKPFSRHWHNQYAINIINTTDGSRKIIIMPKVIAGKPFFPKWKLRPHGDNDRAACNTVLTATPEYRIIYTNRLGDIFAYSETRAEWYLYDSLGLDKVVLTENHDTTLYIAFGMPRSGLDVKRVPTGLIAYNIATKKYRVLFNNQCLKPRYEIEKQRRLQIKTIVPVDNGLYFITRNSHSLESFCFYDKTTQNIKTLFSQNNTLHLNGNSQNNLLLNYIWGYFFQDFKNFTLAVNNDRFYYRKNLSEQDHRWQWNNYIYYMRTLIDFQDFITLKHNNDLVIIGNKNKIYNSMTVHYWKQGHPKSKVIPITLENCPDLKRKNVINLTTVICNNSLFLLGKNDRIKTFIWKLDFEQFDTSFKQKLSYPYIFPYGVAYNSHTRKISFWQRQQITIETMTAGSEIRYTTDGSWPNRTSTLYKQPFVIKRSMKIIARTFRKGFIPSDPFIVSYRKARPRSYIIGDFDSDGKDEVLGNVGYLLKTPENNRGIGKTILHPKANGDFFLFKHKNMPQQSIGYRKYNYLYWGIDRIGGEYKRIAYPASTKKSKFLTGDFNGDGNIDTAFIQNNILQLDINRDGKFDREINYDSAAKIDQWLSCDWNRDGKDDIIFRTGTQFSIDTNLDGKADIIYQATNASSNDTWVTGDWNGDGSPTMAILNNGKIIPVKTQKQVIK